MRPVEHADSVCEVPPPGDGGLAEAAKMLRLYLVAEHPDCSRRDSRFRSCPCGEQLLRLDADALKRV